MAEVWKDIPGYEGIYQVSNLGRVKGLKRKSEAGRNIREKIMRTPKKSNGYLTVGLFKEGKQKTKDVHRLVAETYIEANDAKNEVNHINGDKRDNRVTNLEWCDRSQNVKHSYETGLRSSIIHIAQKSRRKPIVVIGEERCYYDSITQACNDLDLCAPSVSRCLNGKAKTHKNYRFEYA